MPARLPDDPPGPSYDGPDVRIVPESSDLVTPPERITAAMRAMVVRESGAIPEPVELPTPAVGAGEILVRLAAAGLTGYDRMLLTGPPAGFPLVPGVDGAGTVAAVGPGVRGFAVGDRVVGAFRTRPGTCAEFGASPVTGTIARLPEGIGLVQAAALPTAGLIAQRLVDAAEPGPGQRVLINGSVSEIGSLATQLAKASGAHVLAVARAADADRMIRLGADEVIDPLRAPVAEQLRHDHPRGVDVLFDPVSPPAVLTHLCRLVRPGGLVLSTLGAADADRLRAAGLRGGNIGPSGDADDLRRLLRRVTAGDLVIPVDVARPLTDLGAVLAAADGGKAVLVI
ncbi:NADP-dependent oxidoreductase [Nocardia sp. NPDC004068]|uniref:NADP-dependent oxidoreductase n=1 Tax=Nocardia sp. NPDC004068 TaxID=3364303 RepID=UPI003683A1A6